MRQVKAFALERLAALTELGPYLLLLLLNNHSQRAVY